MGGATGGIAENGYVRGETHNHMVKTVSSWTHPRDTGAVIWNRN